MEKTDIEVQFLHSIQDYVDHSPPQHSDDYLHLDLGQQGEITHKWEADDLPGEGHVKNEEDDQDKYAYTERAQKVNGHFEYVNSALV